MSIDICIVKAAWDAYYEKGEWHRLQAILARFGCPTLNKLWLDREYYSIITLMRKVGFDLEAMGLDYQEIRPKVSGEIWHPFEALSVLE